MKFGMYVSVEEFKGFVQRFLQKSTLKGGYWRILIKKSFFDLLDLDLKFGKIVYKGRAEADIPLRRFRRKHEQLSHLERRKIIGMMEAGWSARREPRQLDRSDCVMRRCWDQWIREMTFTRRAGSGHPRQISCRAECNIVRNGHAQPTA
ncbi:transposable element Tcb2 transposase [Trichonephila clavipes]|uniref:Transposable element Tcb2 transposase n=1 Tax=Trichonephila clavipes TaxID=2585209 RepID=A0A8X6UST1_TRICX|nr:transposable element Tcb2 transposase [Trichonephila clavipes]